MTKPPSTRGSFTIGDTEIARGTRETVGLPVSVFANHTPAELMVHVIHGKRPGPCVFVSAGIHGDEVIGVEVCRRLLRAPNLDTLKGTLLVVPVVNAFGFLNHSRYLPDRRDLNRSFPGSSSGSLAARLAKLFLAEVVLRCDFGIDLHSAAVHRTNLPQIRISPGNTRTRALAMAFGAPVVLTSPLRDGSLRGEAKARGVDVLLYEAGEGLRFDETSVRAGVAGILRVLHAKGMISRRGVPRSASTPLMVGDSAWLRAPAGGLVRMYRSEGEIVADGDLLATVSDPFGAEDVELLAPSGGIIVGRAVMPIVNEGDALYHLGDLPARRDAEAAMEDHTEALAQPLFDEDEII
ncbi:MAG: succinylglutamate desuccinylase/aspartoacylase family protein [Pseudomonadota bacterium]